MIHGGFRAHRFDDDDDQSTDHESHTGGQPMQPSYGSHNTPMRQPIVAGYSVAARATTQSYISPFGARPVPSNGSSATIPDDIDYARLRGLKIANV